MAPAVPEVTIEVVKTQPVTLTTELSGRTAAYMVAEVRPQVGGIIRKRAFTEGATVKAGELLYEIDASPFRSSLEQQQAALASARASLRNSQLVAERYEKLLPSNVISRQDYDSAMAAYQEAQANVQLQTATANSARINLEWTQVRAPIGGRTGRSLVTAGALVSANQATPLTTISQLDPIYVDVTQSSADMLRLRKALNAGEFTRKGSEQPEVSLVTEDGSPYPHKGRIQFSEVTVDDTTGAVTLRAVFANPDGLLLPGMYVRAVVTEGVDEQGILAPQLAVRRDRKGNPTARIVNAEDKLEVRQIVTTRVIGDRWLVTSGLQAGDRLVVEGAREAQPGAAVKIAPSTAAR